MEKMFFENFEGSLCGGHGSEDEVLHNERAAMRVSLGSMGVDEPPGVCRKKNSEDSIKYRNYGNDFYKTKMPDDRTHEKVWRFYTQSIALAPNGSSELALGYGNRSALLLHLEKYEDCIKDCDRAIEITSCEFLKCKLMCRKAECLSFLNKNSAKSVCDDALKILSQLSIKDDLKYKFADKLHNILNTLQISNFSKKNNNPDNLSEIANLKYQKEAPCASTSIKISHNKEWGRHIIATKDIKPGDIVAIEDNLCTLLLRQGMYLFCSNCVQPAWSSIPCRYCIYDVYCSEKCMSEAWNRYHQYECPIYPYIWDIDENIPDIQHAIRLLLIMIHNAGGIEQLKKTTTDVEYCKDLRTRGFSSDGIFRSNDPGSMYSHMCGADNFIIFSRITDACTNVYLLATKTDLFGKKMNLEPSEMLSNDDILFVGAFLARIASDLQQHMHVLSHEFERERIQYKISFSAFNSLFNHSCNPNTEFLPVNNNKTVIYAKHPINKGEQLFINYRGEHYLSTTKKQRHEDLKKVFGFKCNCLACSENWSNICVPSSGNIFDATHGLDIEVQQILNVKNCCLLSDNFKYSLESVQTIKFILNTLSTKLTVHCTDYFNFEEDLRQMYIKYFGNWTFDMFHNCII